MKKFTAKRKITALFSLGILLVVAIISSSIGVYAWDIGDPSKPYQIQLILNGRDYQSGGLTYIYNKGNETTRTIVSTNAKGIRTFLDNKTITKVVWLNNSLNNLLGYRHGHSAVLIINNCGESIFNSFFPQWTGTNVPGESRIKYMDKPSTTNFLYGGSTGGYLANVIASVGDKLTGHIESESYNRFISFNVTDAQGRNVLAAIADRFLTVPQYVIPGTSCDNVAAGIFNGNGDYRVDVCNTPNFTITGMRDYGIYVNSLKKYVRQTISYVNGVVPD
jgi:hypothetical protein